MTYEQFWFGDPWMTRAYAQSYLLKRKAENEKMWLMGAYVANAFGVVLGNAFSKHGKQKYLEKPFDIFEKTEAEKEAEKRRERQKVIDWLNSLKAASDKVKKDTGVGKNGESGNT